MIRILYITSRLVKRISKLFDTSECEFAYVVIRKHVGTVDITQGKQLVNYKHKHFLLS